MSQSQLDLTPFKKAIASLEDVLAQPKNEYTRDATIQRFEYTYELAWKMLKRYLALEAGIEEFNIKNLYREAGRQQLIDNVEQWFVYHKARNLTSHTYNQRAAEETYSIIQQFFPDVKKLFAKLSNKS